MSGDETEDISGFVNTSKKRIYEENSDEEMEKAPPTKKKPATESLKSGTGIHRALSVKSGYSNMSKSTSGKSTRSNKTDSNKKKQGKHGKIEPYAYIPVDRKMLNKKRKFNNQISQFKSVVKVKRIGQKTGKKKKH